MPRGQALCTPAHRDEQPRVRDLEEGNQVGHIPRPQQIPRETFPLSRMFTAELTHGASAPFLPLHQRHQKTGVSPKSVAILPLFPRIFPQRARTKPKTQRRILCSAHSHRNALPPERGAQQQQQQAGAGRHLAAAAARGPPAGMVYFAPFLPCAQPAPGRHHRPTGPHAARPTDLQLLYPWTSKHSKAPLPSQHLQIHLLTFAIERWTREGKASISLQPPASCSNPPPLPAPPGDKRPEKKPHKTAFTASASATQPAALSPRPQTASLGERNKQITTNYQLLSPSFCLPSSALALKSSSTARAPMFRWEISPSCGRWRPLTPHLCHAATARAGAARGAWWLQAESQSLALASRISLLEFSIWGSRGSLGCVWKELHLLAEALSLITSKAAGWDRLLEPHRLQAGRLRHRGGFGRWGINAVCKPSQQMEESWAIPIPSSQWTSRKLWSKAGRKTAAGIYVQFLLWSN